MCTTSCDSCVTCQGFCQVGSQYASSYFSAPWGTFAKDDIIIEKLPRATYNAAFTYVANAAAMGSKQDSGGWTGTGETRDFIYADKTNELVAGINSLNGTQCIVPTFIKDVHIVYASYFNTISAALSNLLISQNACDLCNSGCDECNTCQRCNTCQSDA